MTTWQTFGSKGEGGSKLGSLVCRGAAPQRVWARRGVPGHSGLAALALQRGYGEARVLSLAVAGFQSWGFSRALTQVQAEGFGSTRVALEVLAREQGAYASRPSF
jgi:hypothetical protein